MLIASFLNILIQRSAPLRRLQALRGNTATISKSFSYCIPKMGTLFLASSLVALGIGFGFFDIRHPRNHLDDQVVRHPTGLRGRELGSESKHEAQRGADKRLPHEGFFLLLIMIVTNQIVQRLLTFIAQLIFPYKIIALLS